MSITDQFVCTKVRFQFWNGDRKNVFTVHYAPGLRMWFVFEGEKDTDCLAKYELGKKEKPVVSHAIARDYLDKYFQDIKSDFYTVNY